MKTTYSVEINYLYFDFDEIGTAADFAEVAADHFSERNLKNVDRQEIAVRVLREEETDG